VSHRQQFEPAVEDAEDLVALEVKLSTYCPICASDAG
jgi:hypothetical protein